MDKIKYAKNGLIIVLVLLLCLTTYLVLNSGQKAPNGPAQISEPQSEDNNTETENGQ